MSMSRFDKAYAVTDPNSVEVSQNNRLLSPSDLPALRTGLVG